MAIKVSVAMPVYNGSAYIGAAVESVLAQDYDLIEAIIVNDGSTDGGKTASVCRHYADTYPEKIKYVEQSNTGVSGALNNALRHMTGEIFSWLSHDDLFEPHKTRVQIERYNKIARRDAMLCSDYYLIDPEGKVIGQTKFDYQAFLKAPQLPLHRGAVNGCTVFIPRHLLKTDPFDLQKRHAQDYWLWHELIARSEFFFIDQPLVRYRVHPSQNTNSTGHVVEGEEIWRHMIDQTSDLSRVQMYGSSWKFFDETWKIMNASPYKTVTSYVAARRDTCLEKTVVSVVIPFFNEIPLVRRAVASVLYQSHFFIEILLVDDGSTDDLSDLEKFIQKDPRIRLFRQKNSGAATARNVGLENASGDYIAFLDADDVWLPEKVQRQLEAMAKSGSKFSHTSYYVTYPEMRPDVGLVSSGKFTGAVYPQILSGCPIATPTVMLHRSLVLEEFRFPTHLRLGEDVSLWIWTSARTPILGIDEPLSVVELSHQSAALDLRKNVAGLTFIAETVSNDLLHSHFSKYIENLYVKRRDYEKQLARDQDIDEEFLEYAFSKYQEPEMLPAMAEALSGQLETALQSFARYLTYDPGSAVIWYWYGSILAELGRIDEANEIFKRGLLIPLHKGNFRSSRILQFLKQK